MQHAPEPASGPPINIDLKTESWCETHYQKYPKGKGCEDCQTVITLK